MSPTFTTWGAVAGLVFAIVLIVRKANPAYSLMLGAFVGGLLGGGGVDATINAIIDGAQGMASSIMRILTSGVLVGALIKTGSAQKIAESIVDRFGSKHAIPAIVLASALICGVGVFVDIAVITVAPVALAVGKKAGINKESIILALLGGAKAGNIVSPNPNTLAAAEAFQVDLTALMAKNLLPAIFAIVVAIVVANLLAKRKKGVAIRDVEVEAVEQKLPSFLEAALGPVVAIALLMLRPIFNVNVDPLLALPIGGFVCILVTRQGRETLGITEFGLSKVAGVAILLLGTGAIAGVVKDSAIQVDFTNMLQAMNLAPFLLAPLSGALLAAATGSTTAAATIASQTFADPLLTGGVSGVAAAAMINAGATAIDQLPQGSFFHATAGATHVSFSERFKLIPYEACVGFTSAVAATLLYMIS